MAYKSRKSKSLNCKLCGDEVKNVGEDATAVTCWRCVNKMMSGEINKCTDDGDIQRKNISSQTDDQTDN